MSVFDAIISLAREPVKQEGLTWILDSIREGNDTSAAIVGGMFVEATLLQAIHSRIVDLDKTRQG